MANILDTIVRITYESNSQSLNNDTNALRTQQNVLNRLIEQGRALQQARRQSTNTADQERYTNNLRQQLRLISETRTRIRELQQAQVQQQRTTQAPRPQATSQISSRLGSAFSGGALNQLAGGDAIGGVTSAISGLAGATGPVGAGIGLLATALTNLGVQAFETRKKFETLEATLTNLYGSQAKSEQAFGVITEFVAKTPFQVDEVTSQFIKLSNVLGKFFDTEIEQKALLQSIGDLAASFGKPFEQVSEAVIDAQRGQFARLEEALGANVTRLNNNTKLKVDFRGQTFEIQNNAKSIVDLVGQFGKLQGIYGTTNTISNTLQGKVSNLGDAWDRLLNTLGKEGDATFKNIIDGITSLVTATADLIEYWDNLDAETIFLKIGQGFANFQGGVIDALASTIPFFSQFGIDLSEALGFDKIADDSGKLADTIINKVKLEKQIKNSLRVTEEESLKLIKNKSALLTNQLTILQNTKSTEAQRQKALSIISKETGVQVKNYNDSLKAITSSNDKLQKGYELTLLKTKTQENLLFFQTVENEVLQIKLGLEQNLAVIRSNASQSAKDEALNNIKSINAKAKDLRLTVENKAAEQKALNDRINFLKSQGIVEKSITKEKENQAKAQDKSNKSTKDAFDFAGELKRRYEDLTKALDDLLERQRKLAQEIKLLEFGENKGTEIAIKTKVEFDRENAQRELDKIDNEFKKFKTKDKAGKDIVIDIRTEEFIKNIDILRQQTNQKFSLQLELELSKFNEQKAKALNDLQASFLDTTIRLDLIDIENSIKGLEIIRGKSVSVGKAIVDELFVLQNEANSKRLEQDKIAIDKRYQAELDKLKETFEKGFLETKQYTDAIAQLEADKNREVEQLEFESKQNLLKINDDYLQSIIDATIKSNEKIQAENRSKEIEELIELNDLYSKKEISEEEYQKRKQDIEAKYKKVALQLELLDLQNQLRLKQELLKQDGVSEEKKRKTQEEIDALNQQIAEVRLQLSSLGQGGASLSSGLEKFNQKAQLIVSSLNSLFSELTNFIQQQLDAIDKRLDAQQKRVDNAREQANNGNAKFYELEQDRLERLQATREKIAQREESLKRLQIVTNQALAISNSIVAITNAAAQGGIAAPVVIATNTIAILTALATLKGAFSQQAFAEGTSYVDSPNAPQGKDTIPAWLDRGERVIPTRLNKKYWSVLEEIQNDTPKARQLLNGKVLGNSIIQAKVIEYSNNNVVREIKDLKSVISNLTAPATKVSIDEKGIFAIQERQINRLNKARKL